MTRTQRGRTAFAALGTALAVWACDSTTEIPLEPESDIQINGIAINRHTMQPAQGSTSPAGTQGIAFNLDVFYQVTPAEFARQGDAAWMSLWLETYDADGDWVGDLVDRSFGSGTPSGEVSASGTFRAPSISPLCLPLRYVALAAQLWAEDPGAGQSSELTNEKAGGSAYDVVLVTEVTGATGTTSACLVYEAWVRESTFWWGEPLFVYARNAPVSGTSFLPGSGSDIRFAVGDQFATTLLENDLDGPYSRFLIWVPPATGGGLRMFVAGLETDYGADVRMPVTYSGDLADFLESNDSFDDAVVDWAATEWLNTGSQTNVLLWHPYLSLPAFDQEVDGTANPDGFTDWGLGDWFSLPVDTDMDVCAWLYPSTGDDVDLLLYDADGTLWVASTNAGDASEFVRLNDVPAGMELRLWAAPYDIGTGYGIYSVAAGNCASFGADAADADRLPEPRQAGEGLGAVVERAAAFGPGIGGRRLRHRHVNNP